MTAVQLHLLTAHLPVLGVPFAGVLLAAGLFGRSETLWRTGIVALLLAAATAIVPYFSGPTAYNQLRRSAVPGVTIEKQVVERHAVAARAASLGLVLLVAVTMSSLLRAWQGDKPSWLLRLTILLGAVGLAAALGWSAHLGGLVRRPDLATARSFDDSAPHQLAFHTFPNPTTDSPTEDRL